MSITLSFGPYGGFYIHTGNCYRICLGWVAITFMKMELEDLVNNAEAHLLKEITDTISESESAWVQGLHPEFIQGENSFKNRALTYLGHELAKRV